MSDYELIGGFVWDPTGPNLFKAKASDKAECTKIFCCRTDCPLRAAGQCVEANSIALERCPYGRRARTLGPTRRAAGFNKWIRERKDELAGKKMPEFAVKRMAMIGEYVYLPYPHMDMNRGVPFLKHSAVFVSGSPFIAAASWTVETVQSIVRFRPEALFGGEITDYQAKTVPLFVQHLREVDNAMWLRLVELEPRFNVERKYVGRKALVSTLNYPITIPPYDSRYPVSWEWNGETLVSNDTDAYGKTWGNVVPGNVRVEIVPSEKSVVVVKDNSWVNENTKFVD